VFDHVKSLHRSALQASNTDLYAVQLLQDQLEEADRQQQQAAIREQAFLEALQARQQRIADLETSRLELESALDTERSQRQRVSDDSQRQQKNSEEEIRRLREEISTLKEQIGLAHSAKLEMESRCGRCP